MKFGYMGKILMVDLSIRDIREEIVPDDVYEQYLSGMGLAAYILYNRIPTGADPLGPDNILGFISGLLTGTGSLFAGRWMVVGQTAAAVFLRQSSGAAMTAYFSRESVKALSIFM